MIPSYNIYDARSEKMLLIYSMYREDEFSVHRACCERATQPYSLGRGGGKGGGYMETKSWLYVGLDNNCTCV